MYLANSACSRAMKGSPQYTNKSESRVILHNATSAALLVETTVNRFEGLRLNWIAAFFLVVDIFCHVI